MNNHTQYFMLERGNVMPLHDDAVSLVLCFDDTFAPQVAAAVTSVISAANSHDIYDIILLTSDVSDANKKKLESISTREKKVFIRVLVVPSVFSSAYVHMHFSQAAYLRLLIPDILRNFRRTLYLDSDLIVRRDIAELFRTPIKDKLIAARRDPKIQSFYQEGAQFEIDGKTLGFQVYFENVVGVSVHDYVNAGVMLLNNNALNQIEFTRKCIELALQNKFLFLDQDILNKVVPQDCIYFLDDRWNVFAQPGKSGETDHLAEAYIIHFVGSTKPWNSFTSPYASEFWVCARQSGYLSMSFFELAAYCFHNMKKLRHAAFWMRDYRLWKLGKVIHDLKSSLV